MVPLPRVPATLQAVIKENSSLYFQIVLANRVRDETLRKYLSNGSEDCAMTSTDIFKVLRDFDFKRLFVLAAVEDMFEILVMAWRFFDHGGNLLHWLTYEGKFDILFVAVANQSWKVVEFYLGAHFEHDSSLNVQYQKTLAPLVDEWILISNIMHYIACDDVERFLTLLMKYRPHLFMDSVEGQQLRNEFGFERRYIGDLVRTSVSLGQFKVLDWIYKYMPSEFEIRAISMYNIGNYISRCEDYGEYSKAVKMMKWFWKNAPEHIWVLSSCQDGVMYRGCRSMINSVNVNAERLRFKSISVLRELAGESFFDRQRYQVPPWYCMFSGIVSMYISDHVKFAERFGEIEEMPFLKLYETATKRRVDVNDTDVDGNTILHYLFGMAVLTKEEAPTKDDHCVVQFIVARILMFLELNKVSMSRIWDVKNRDGKTPVDVAKEKGLQYLLGFAWGVDKAGNVYNFVCGEISEVFDEDAHIRCLRDSMKCFLQRAFANGHVRGRASLMVPKRCGNLAETMNSVQNRPKLMTPFSLSQSERLVEFMRSACVKWEEFMQRSNFELTDEKIDTIVKNIEGTEVERPVSKKKRNGGKRRGKGLPVSSQAMDAGVDPGATQSVDGKGVEWRVSPVTVPEGEAFGELSVPLGLSGLSDALEEVDLQQAASSKGKKEEKFEDRLGPCVEAVATGLEEKSAGCCVVCFVEKCTHAYVPCGHMAVCQGCSELYSSRCVICNRDCVMCVKIFEQSV